MKSIRWMGLVLVVVLVSSSCSSSKSDPAMADNGASAGGAQSAKIGGSTPRPAGEGPDSAVWDFLESVRTGNDERANKMLTPLARQKVGETQMVLAPPGTDTARFAIVKLELVGDDGARVYVDWTDLDYNGKPRTDQTIWMVRHEAEGWRIAGMAVPIFDNEPMVLMNFEDPDDMLKKQKMVHDEIRRRAEQTAAASSGESAPAGADQVATPPSSAPSMPPSGGAENGQAASPSERPLR